MTTVGPVVCLRSDPQGLVKCRPKYPRKRERGRNMHFSPSQRVSAVQSLANVDYDEASIIFIGAGGFVARVCRAD
jgi:hypothetical protein